MGAEEAAIARAVIEEAPIFSNLQVAAMGPEASGLGDLLAFAGYGAPTTTPMMYRFMPIDRP